jgi:nucleoside-diphosphate-sugar epimerase
MKILVTGGSGSIGIRVVDDLKSEHAITVFDIAEPHTASCRHISGSILDPEALRETMQGMDVVIHLAGGHQSTDPHEVFGINAQGTFNVLESMARAGVTRLIHASSDSAFGLVFRKTHFCPEAFPIIEEMDPMPQDSYGLAKLAAENICRGYGKAYGIRSICLRHCWVWSRDSGGVDHYADRSEIAAKGDDGRETWLNIGRLWGYVDISDVVKAYHLALGRIDDVEHEVLFLSAADTFTEEKSLDLITEYFPDTKSIGEVYRTDPYRSLFSCDKALRILGWKPQVSWRNME